ncbi:MAG TPA: hypothetical protein PKA63_05940 [Oligoflexia bacterium]|nr:hypothetical protein [Oligoflexia bacterium]HMP48191.1 hypothetical protein [Oligoflexia bacterium]
MSNALTDSSFIEGSLPPVPRPELSVLYQDIEKELELASDFALSGGEDPETLKVLLKRFSEKFYAEGKESFSKGLFKESLLFLFNPDTSNAYESEKLVKRYAEILTEHILSSDIKNVCSSTITAKYFSSISPTENILFLASIYKQKNPNVSELLTEYLSELVYREFGLVSFVDLGKNDEAPKRVLPSLFSLKPFLQILVVKEKSHLLLGTLEHLKSFSKEEKNTIRIIELINSFSRFIDETVHEPLEKKLSFGDSILKDGESLINNLFSDETDSSFQDEIFTEYLGSLGASIGGRLEEWKEELLSAQSVSELKECCLQFNIDMQSVFSRVFLYGAHIYDTESLRLGFSEVLNELGKVYGENSIEVSGLTLALPVSIFSFKEALDFSSRENYLTFESENEKLYIAAICNFLLFIKNKSVIPYDESDLVSLLALFDSPIRNTTEYGLFDYESVLMEVDIDPVAFSEYSALDGNVLVRSWLAMKEEIYHKKLSGSFHLDFFLR